MELENENTKQNLFSSIFELFFFFLFKSCAACHGLVVIGLSLDFVSMVSGVVQSYLSFGFAYLYLGYLKYYIGLFVN